MLMADAPPVCRRERPGGMTGKRLTTRLRKPQGSGSRTGSETTLCFPSDTGSLSFGEIVSRAEKKTGKSEDGNGNTVYTVEYFFDGVKATCTALLYGNSAAVDWVCGFENTGNADSQPITGIYAADTVVDITDAEVNYANGSNGQSR